MEKTCSHESGNQKTQASVENLSKKSSKKWILSLLILVALVMALGAFGYYKWFVPYRVESYVTKAVSDYNRLQDDLDGVSTAFSDLEILDINSINRATGRIDNAIEISESVLANENDRRVPYQTKELHNKLIVYYDDVNEALISVEGFAIYFKQLAPVVRDLNESTVSTQEGSSDQVEGILTNARNIQEKLEADLKKLNRIDAPTDLSKLHDDFADFLKSHTQFILELIELVEVEDYEGIETLTEQEGNEQNKYSDRFKKDIDDFEKNSQIGGWSEDLTKQEEEIEDLVAELKSKYNF